MSNYDEYAQLARMGVHTDRSERSYIWSFKARPEERILDIGSGMTNFRRLPNLVQLDFAYTDPHKRPPRPTRPVAALAQQLPFKNGVFDRVTLRWSNLHFNERGAAQVTRESLRVL